MSVRHKAKILNFNKGSLRKEAPVSNCWEHCVSQHLKNTDCALNTNWNDGKKNQSYESGAN